MSRILVHSAHFTTARSTRSAELFLGMNTMRMRLLIIGTVAVLGVAYLWLVNSSTSAGFELSQLEDHRVSLESEYHDLQETEVALRSLEHIQEQAHEAKLVAQTTPTYVDRAEHAVALKSQ